jgi:hypothetical protein
MDLFKESLLVRNKVVETLEFISNEKFYIGYNDLYGRKSEVVRRLKGGFGKWVKREEWIKWKNKLESISNYENFKIEFNCVDKVNSVGGFKNVEFNRQRFVENGIGSISEFNDRFNNEDYYFVIRIIWNK